MPERRHRIDELAGQKVGARLSALGVAVFAIAVVVAWQLLPPPLPRVVRFGTGPVDSHYARFGEAFRNEVAEDGITLEIVQTAGSMENIRLLLAGEIDVGLVQSGNLSDAEAEQLQSIAALFHEPVLVVERAEWNADHIEGGRIAVGAPGSGAHAQALELLEDQGVTDGVPPGTELVELGGEAAVEALGAGEVDSGIFVTSLDVPWVAPLFADPRLRVTDFELAEAFTRHYRYLSRVVVPAGLVDLRSEIPASDVELIATTASLVIRPGAHHGIIPVMIEAARELLFQGGLLAEPDEFPSPHGVEAPLAEEALQYFERGPSFFYRWLPFRYAFAVTRLAIIALPLLTLLYPLIRSVGPTYRWVMERRVYRWYRLLRRAERKMDDSSNAAELAAVRADLERMGEEIRETFVPSRHAARLYALRAHHRMLLDRLEGFEKRLPRT
jgi:TRAP-type uncharacterized transport system substrate-binding protein